jgi:hypothetical protein
MLVLKSRNVKVRKDRQCFCCERKFPIGTQMNYIVGVDSDNQFYAIYNCVTCTSILEKVYDEIPPGYVRELLEPGQTPEDLLQHLDR